MAGTDQGWSDYWQQNTADGEVFVNAEGESHAELGEFWRSILAELEDGKRIIDLASGAGSIFANLPAAHGHALTAADISEVALTTLSERIGDVKTIVCSADNVPLEDGSFDLVVSQFGIEYAGLDAFSEAARLVAPGGRLVALCHYRDGYIDGANRAQLAEAHVVRDVQFIPKARRLTETTLAGDAAAQRQAEQDFLGAATPVAEAMRRCKQGIHVHLFFGFRQLYENRTQYAPEDIFGWLDAIEDQLDTTIERLEHMRGAALSEADLDNVRERFEAAGGVNVEFTPFYTTGNELPVAWVVTAQREQ